MLLRETGGRMLRRDTGYRMLQREIENRMSQSIHGLDRYKEIQGT
jgi:hypothetical protein